MAFLDNSGDIILDAVLTDTGRMRLAKGDGSFKITKFALADDEINYSLYDKNNPSGSAYYDLQILQTPVLEAFTNNTSSVKSKLLSIARDDLLFLPMLKLFTNDGYQLFNLAGSGENTFIVAVDDTTVKAINNTNDDVTTTATGIINGAQATSTGMGETARIRLDQGLDTTEIPNTLGLDPDLRETQYLVEMDNRLGFLVAAGNSVAANVSFIDDDNIAAYYLTQGDSDFVQSIGADSSIRGPRGTYIQFRIASSTTLKTSDYLFNVLGTAGVENIGQMKPVTDSETYRFIDSFIAVTGITTGYRIEIPIRYVKRI
jgi:hypothetical protein